MDTRVIQLRQRPAISPDDERGHLHRGAMTTGQTTCIRRCLSCASTARPEGVVQTLVADRRLRFVELPQTYPLLWLRAGTLYRKIKIVPDAFIALPEFFRDSVLNLTWSGSVPVWLTSLFRAPQPPNRFLFRSSFCS